MGETYRHATGIALVLLLWGLAPVGFAEEANQPPASPPTVEQLVAAVKPSVVLIRHTGRSARDSGLGTGFVVAAEGLIATNLHVIGEARPISVELADGRSFPVTAVHASDRGADLAVLRIEADGLQPLPLADGHTLVDGQEVVAVGNPHGLERSVVTGRVSGQRNLDGVEMIQVAIPIEAGNSGGPLLDRTGQVHGILTLKSLVTRNLGFAVAADRLQDLLDKPNPVVMEQWLTIGSLDPTEWTTVGGGDWRQRAGRLSVAGSGEGFGGRSLCLATEPPPPIPYEVAVRLRLDDESGAAGLAFAVDGNDRHYGFYPSDGQLRLTRFNGPNVFTWKVLAEVAAPAYRPGEWNHLRVRVEAEEIRCYVNDEEVIVSADHRFRDGRVGLASFRGTEASFRGFAAGLQVPTLQPAAAVLTEVSTATNGLQQVGPAPPAVLEQLSDLGPAALTALELEAVKLDRRSARLRELAGEVHHRQILDQLAAWTTAAGPQGDLFGGAVLIAQLDNPELVSGTARAEVDRLAEAIATRLPEQAADHERIAMLDQILFAELGFHGSRGDYHNPSNSYINEVLDDREGIPITLSVVYMELAKQLDLTVHGIGFPGHFLVRFEPRQGKPEWIDVFERGRRLSRADLAQRLAETTGEELAEQHLEVASEQAIVTRMLNNLLAIAARDEDTPAMLRYLDAMLTIDPESARSRLLRMLTAHRLNRVEIALADGRWLVTRQPAGVDLDRVQRLLTTLEADR